MPRPSPLVVLLAALGPAACAASGDPPSNSGSAPPPAVTPAATSAGAGPGNAAPAAATTQADIDAREVAILTLEQGPSYLRVTGHNRRPRSSFGPSATWNGAGRATHRWRLLSRDGETLAAGDIVVHSGLELPPNPQKGAPAAHVTPETFAFVVKAPHPAPGEALEITAAAGTPVVRWP